MSLERKKLLEFKRDMLKLFDYNLQSYLISNLGKVDYTENYLLESIYSYLGLIPSTKDRHLWFANFIDRIYGTNGNILEVGSGYFPALASHLDRLQSTRKIGTITAYDPKTIQGKLGNITLVKGRFDETVRIENYDLIIGMKPCEATSMIIERANECGKPFAIIECGCPHSGDYYWEASETLGNNMSLNEILLPHSYEVYSPLIYTEQRRI